MSQSCPKECPVCGEYLGKLPFHTFYPLGGWGKLAEHLIDKHMRRGMLCPCGSPLLDHYYIGRWAHPGEVRVLAAHLRDDTDGDVSTHLKLAVIGLVGQ